MQYNKIAKFNNNKILESSNQNEKSSLFNIDHSLHPSNNLLLTKSRFIHSRRDLWRLARAKRDGDEIRIAVHDPWISRRPQ